VCTVRTTLSPVTEIMPDRCTPEYERVLAKLGGLLPYRRARAMLADFFPIGDAPAIDTIHQRTLQVGARLGREAIAAPPSIPGVEAEASELSIDSGHVRAQRSYKVRTFEVFVARISNDDRKQITFSSVPVEAGQQTQQLRGVLQGLGATSNTETTYPQRWCRRTAFARGGGQCRSDLARIGLVSSCHAHPARGAGGQRLAANHR
jgi:hypothetical protein